MVVRSGIALFGAITQLAVYTVQDLGQVAVIAQSALPFGFYLVCWMRYALSTVQIVLDGWERLQGVSKLILPRQDVFC